jgi:hypothetical protein
VAIQLDMVAGDTVSIGDVTVKLLDKSGRRARVAVTAPPDVKVELQSPDTPMRSHIGRVGMGIGES